MDQNKTKLLFELIELINESIDQVLLEQTGPEVPGEDSSSLQTDSTDANVGSTGDDTPSPGDSGSSLSEPGSSGMPTGDGAESLGDDDGIGDSTNSGLGSGGGGVAGLSGGFGGGGMGGGGGGESMSDGDSPQPTETEPVSTANPFSDANSAEERLQVILTSAEDLANQTQDPQVIFKHIKGLIQNGFAEPEKAAKVIADLFDTENPVLQQVSRRLALFTYGI